MNVFETKDWFKANTLTSCEYVWLYSKFQNSTHDALSHPITALDFSHDGEYIAASTTGEYVEIVSTIARTLRHITNTNHSLGRSLVSPCTGSRLQHLRQPCHGIRQSTSLRTVDVLPGRLGRRILSSVCLGLVHESYEDMLNVIALFRMVQNHARAKSARATLRKLPSLLPC